MAPAQQTIADDGSVQPTASTALADPSELPGPGCNIDGEFYMDGMQVEILTYYEMQSISLYNYCDCSLGAQRPQ